MTDPLKLGPPPLLETRDPSGWPLQLYPDRHAVWKNRYPIRPSVLPHLQTHATQLLYTLYQGSLDV